RGKLSQPCRRMLIENGDDAFAVRMSAKLAERFQHRQIWLARAVLFDALSPANKHPTPVGKRRGVGVDDSGFSNAGLAGDEHELSLTIERPSRASLQLFKFRTAFEKSMLPRRCTVFFVIGSLTPHVPQKAISLVRNGLNECWGFGVIAKR